MANENTVVVRELGINTNALHKRLKEIVSKELEGLPALLEKLEPKERVRNVLALLPYVTPKVETVATDYGEPWGDMKW